MKMSKVISKKIGKKLKKAIWTLIGPYVIFILIAVLGIGILFFSVEEFWEELTSRDTSSSVVISNSTYIWPLPGYSYISSYYGYRIHPITGKSSLHNGIDIPAPQNTKVISPANGNVTDVYYSQAVGNTVQIETGEYKFLFHHLNFTTAQKGETINKGDEVGGVGTTGTYSTGNHLHFTVYKNGKLIDPLELINFNNKVEEGSVIQA